MKNHFFRKSMIVSLFSLCLILFLSLSVPQMASAEETELTSQLLAEMEARINAALDAGEEYVDLTDLNIITNMYADRFGEQYQKVLDLCQKCQDNHGSFFVGSHRDPYAAAEPEIKPTEETNSYGVGPNALTGIMISYDPYYMYSDGGADTELIAQTQAKMTQEYDFAMSVVSDHMNDTEKALALYDYLIALTDYPDAEMINEEGIAVYDDETYNAGAVFRDHLSVCVANAIAYCYLLSDCGIPCIRVDSSEMQHSWVMLKLDGAWYHADPTWDNARYENGATSKGDPNDDSWDIGAVSHHYFLKSDREMQEGLEHYGWQMIKDYSPNGSVTELPEASQSGNFDSLFFGKDNIWQEDVNYNYINGCWYFLNTSANQIVKTVYGLDMNKAEYLEAPSGELMKYAYGSGNYLFICDDKGIWRCNTLDGRMERLDLPEARDQRGTPLFTEMNVASGQLNGVVQYQVGEDNWEPVAYSYPVEELLHMAVIPETEEAVETESASESVSESSAESSSAAVESSEAAGTEAAKPTRKSGGILPFVLIGLAAAGGLGAIIYYKKKNGLYDEEDQDDADGADGADPDGDGNADGSNGLYGANGADSSDDLYGADGADDLYDTDDIDDIDD
ncbi:MAG: transglutaminase domain-containing protein, partial [Lachnospiraceae bacterium]